MNQISKNIVFLGQCINTIVFQTKKSRFFCAPYVPTTHIQIFIMNIANIIVYYSSISWRHIRNFLSFWSHWFFWNILALIFVERRLSSIFAITFQHKCSPDINFEIYQIHDLGFSVTIYFPVWFFYEGQIQEISEISHRPFFVWIHIL